MVMEIQEKLAALWRLEKQPMPGLLAEEDIVLLRG
jgi:hypothetical protein